MSRPGALPLGSPAFDFSRSDRMGSMVVGQSASSGRRCAARTCADGNERAHSSSVLNDAASLAAKSPTTGWWMEMAGVSLWKMDAKCSSAP